jgi:multicomponent Na+:H+ antiporter subunit D
MLTVAVSALTGGAALRVALRVHFAVGPRPDPDATGDRVTGQDEEPDMRPPHDTTPPTMAAAIALLLAAGLAIGMFPQVRTLIAQAAGAFTDQHGYWNAAMLGVTASPAVLPDVVWTSSGVVVGLVTALLAVLVAVAGLYPAVLRRLTDLLRPALTTLHRLHSGHVGDYAAWLMFGAATFAVLLILG